MKNQKFFDIIPPERYQKEFPAKKEIRGRRFPLARVPIKKSFFFILFILFLGGILFNLFFQKADIIIWPEAEVIRFKTNVIVNSEVDKADFSNKTIPGTILSSEKVIFQEFLSSGKFLKATKATGILRVYNAYSTSSQVLITNTRFVSAEGRLFRSIQRVTIPGGRYEKGKFQPGLLDIKVIAAEPGPEYNIGPSTFSIPGFAGTVRYTAFYGKSSDSMKGGFREEVSQITQEDLDAALKNVKEKIEKEVENVFKNKISEEFVLIDKAFKIEEQSPIFSNSAGEEGDSFAGEIKVIFKALLFKQLDLKMFIEEFIISEIPEDKILKTDSLKISYDTETIDLKLSQMTLDLDFSATIYSKISTDFLKNEISGKSLKESKIILAEKPNIIKSEVRLLPFWLRKIPKNFQKIKVELRIDDSTSSP